MGLLALFGCNSHAKDFSGSWKIYSFEKEGITQKSVYSEITFEKQGETVYAVNGNSGVNAFFGEVTIRGARLKANSRFGSTKMAGDPEAMTYEDNFLRCLLGADSAKIVTEDNMDYLKIVNKADQSVLTFIKK